MKFKNQIETTAIEIAKFCGIKEGVEFISLGEICISAWYIQEAGLRTGAYPFDWVFSSPEIIIDCINDDFKEFLDKSNMTGLGGAGHLKFHSRFFKHKNPIVFEDNYTYYQRCCERFIEVINSDQKIIYIINLMNDIPKDESVCGWARGFRYNYEQPIEQDYNTYKKLINILKDKNNNSKFIIIDPCQKEKRKITFKYENPHTIFIAYDHIGIKQKNYVDKSDDIYFKKLFSQIK